MLWELWGLLKVETEQVHNINIFSLWSNFVSNSLDKEPIAMVTCKLEQMIDAVFLLHITKLFQTIVI